MATANCNLAGFSSTLRCLTIVKAWWAAVRPVPPPNVSPPFTTMMSSGSSLASEYTLCGLVSVSANTEESSSSEELRADSSRSLRWRRRRLLQWCSCRCCCCSSAWWSVSSSRAGGVRCRRRSRLVTVTWSAVAAAASTSAAAGAGATGFRSTLVAPPNSQSRVPVPDGLLFRLFGPARDDGVVELCRLPIVPAQRLRYGYWCSKACAYYYSVNTMTVHGDTTTWSDDDYKGLPTASGYPLRKRTSRPTTWWCLLPRKIYTQHSILLSLDNVHNIILIYIVIVITLHMVRCTSIRHAYKSPRIAHCVLERTCAPEKCTYNVLFFFLSKHTILCSCIPYTIVPDTLLKYLLLAYIL